MFLIKPLFFKEVKTTTAENETYPVGEAFNTEPSMTLAQLQEKVPDHEVIEISEEDAAELAAQQEQGTATDESNPDDDSGDDDDKEPFA